MEIAEFGMSLSLKAHAGHHPTPLIDQVDSKSLGVEIRSLDTVSKIRWFYNGTSFNLVLRETSLFTKQELSGLGVSLSLESDMT